MSQRQKNLLLCVLLFSSQVWADSYGVNVYPSGSFVQPQSQLSIQAGIQLQSAPAVRLKNNLSDEQGISFQLQNTSARIFDSAWSSKLDVQIHSLNSTGSLLIGLPEAFVMRPLASAQQSGYSFALGRRIMPSSEADRALGLGLVNPTLTTDQIEKTQQGVFGIHSRIQTAHSVLGTFGLSLTGQALYLPNQSPGVENKNKELIAVNRWAPAPPAKLRFNDELKDIEYAISDLDYAKIVNQQGYMAQLDWAGESLMAKMGFGDMPLNDLTISREIFTDLDLRPKVNLDPVVTRHQVASFEASHVSLTSESEFKTTLGVLSSSPIEKNAEAGFETQKPQDAVVTSFITGWKNRHLESSFIQEIELTIANISGGQMRDEKASGEPAQITLANSRFQFTQPVQVLVKSVWLDRKNHIISNDTKFVHDREQNGSLVDSKMTWQLKRYGLRIDAGVTVLGVQNVDESLDDSDRGFLDKYSSQDRVYGGVTYVF